MDTTGLGIALGLVVVIWHIWHKRDFESNKVVLLFLAAFSIPGGLGLIFAGLKGSYSELPSSWREHVVVAGIVAIGLAGKYVYDEFKGTSQSVSEAAEVNAEPE